MHGVIGLKCGQRDEAGARAEGDGVGHDALVADDRVELAVVDVAVLAQVDVGHAVQRQALEVADEIGRHGGHEALLRHNARLHIVKLQLGVIARHLTWWRGVNFTGEHYGNLHFIESKVMPIYAHIKLKATPCNKQN